MICQRCLEKNPSGRYPTAKSLAEDLDRFLLGEPINASTNNIHSAFQRWSRREPSLAGHLIGLGLIELTRAVSYVTDFVISGYEIDQYLRYSYIILAWAFTCFMLQKASKRFGENRRGVNPHRTLPRPAADIGFLTYILWSLPGHIGPLYIAYTPVSYHRKRTVFACSDGRFHHHCLLNILYPCFSIEESGTPRIAIRVLLDSPRLS